VSTDGNSIISSARTRWLSGILRQGRKDPASDKLPGGDAEIPPEGGENLNTGEARFIVTDVDDGLYDYLEEELYAFNTEVTGHRDIQLLRVAARDDDGALVAGLSGLTWGGCGYIHLMWVRADFRRTGLGTQVLEAGENEIRRRGCDQIALCTHSFQAPGFYIKAGYSEYGRISAFPHGHEQIHFVKRLS
jgi:GNAT superfamily N-acetyltransferase